MERGRGDGVGRSVKRYVEVLRGIRRSVKGGKKSKWWGDR